MGLVSEVIGLKITDFITKKCHRQPKVSIESRLKELFFEKIIFFQHLNYNNERPLRGALGVYTDKITCFPHTEPMP